MKEAKWLALSFRVTHEAAEAVCYWLSAQGASGVETIDKEEFADFLCEPPSLDYLTEECLSALPDDVRIRAFFPLEESVGQLQAETRLSIHAQAEYRSELYDHHPRRPISLAEFEAEVKAMLLRVAEYLETGEGYLGAELIREEDWAENWKNYYQTLHPSPRLVVNPSWLEYEKKAGERVLHLDPGLAFGTGSHESTALCLGLLDEWQARDPEAFAAMDILDLGTGSGILALAAASLGAVRVDALDIDPEAVRCAAENAERNSVRAEIISPGSFTKDRGDAPILHLLSGELRHTGEKRYDLILANLITKLHLQLADDYAAHLRPGGLLILSGIIGGKEAEVTEAMSKAALVLEESRQRRDWWALVFRKAADGNVSFVTVEDSRIH